MQTCKICEKAIYGHVVSSSKDPVVCGSCTLRKVDNEKTGKSVFQVRPDLTKLVPTSKLTMADSIVQSNYARNRTILLDGRYPLVFDSVGKARCPKELDEAFGREMAAKPGRYWYASDREVVVPVAPVALEIAPVVFPDSVELEPVATPLEVAQPELPVEVSVKLKPEPVVGRGRKSKK